MNAAINELGCEGLCVDSVQQLWKICQLMDKSTRCLPWCLPLFWRNSKQFGANSRPAAKATNDCRKPRTRLRPWPAQMLFGILKELAPCQVVPIPLSLYRWAPLKTGEQSMGEQRTDKLSPGGAAELGASHPATRARTSAICGRQSLAHVHWIGLPAGTVDDRWDMGGGAHYCPQSSIPWGAIVREAAALGFKAETTKKKNDVYRWACHSICHRFYGPKIRGVGPEMGKAK